MADRIAVIADVHGNADALRAVLSDIAEQGADLILNLGDHFSGPLAAGETADILCARNDILSIRGNHDRWLTEKTPGEMGASDAVAFAELSPDHLDWLRALPATREEGDLFLCHGTPKSDTTYWLETVQGAGVTQRPLAEVEAYARDVTHPIMLCGHTHLPRTVRLSTGQWIVNPGSVGCPGYDDDQPAYHIVQSGNPAASYAVLTRRAANWHITHRLVPYDTTRMTQAAQRNGRAEWAEAVSTGWITHPAP